MYRLIAVMGTAYLLQALVINPGMIALPLTLYLKETLNLSATAVTLMGVLAFLPWTIKPIWGLICDSFTVFGSQFWAYFAACYGVAAIALLSLTVVSSPSLPLLASCAVLVSCGIAFSDVLTDRLMVLEGRRLQQTAVLQAAQWTAMGLGAAIASWAGGWFAAQRSLGAVSAVSVGLLIGGGILLWCCLSTTQSPSTSPALRQTLNAIQADFRNPRIRRLMGFVMLLGLCPLPPFLFYLRDTLQLSEQTLGSLGAIAALAGSVGAVMFGWVVRKFSQTRRAGLAVGMGSLAVLSMAIAQSPSSAIGAYLVMGFATTLATLSILSLIAELCSLTAAATSFALMVSINNLSALGGSAIGAGLYDLQWPFLGLVAIGAGCTALVGLLIPWLQLEPVTK